MGKRPVETLQIGTAEPYVQMILDHLYIQLPPKIPHFSNKNGIFLKQNPVFLKENPVFSP
jgi:hypothetical protein